VIDARLRSGIGFVPCRQMAAILASSRARASLGGFDFARAKQLSQPGLVGQFFRDRIRQKIGLIRRLDLARSLALSAFSGLYFPACSSTARCGGCVCVDLSRQRQPCPFSAPPSRAPA